MSQILQYLFIAILCAKMYRVTWALHRNNDTLPAFVVINSLALIFVLSFAFLFVDRLTLILVFCLTFRLVDGFTLKGRVDSI
jgi:hypothetical protein